MGAVDQDNLISEMKIIIFLALCLASCLGQRLSPPRNPPTEPAQGQRCAGRNYNGRRCCTPENPCGYGEGDCDGPGDGGANDGHQGCQGDLVCGSNNCKKFGLYYHEKDDCCERPEGHNANPNNGYIPYGGYDQYGRPIIIIGYPGYPGYPGGYNPY